MPTDRLSATFAALADPTRRAILARLALGETSVTELAEPFDMSLPAVSKHLKVLERAGLIARGREAQWRPCRIEPNALRDGRRLARALSPAVGGAPRPAGGLPEGAAGQGEEAQARSVAARSSIDLERDPRRSSPRACSMRRARWCWTVWTDPKHLAQWWGPNGFTTTTSAFDMRPGGVWRFVMHGPDGRDYENRITFDEIVKPERIRYHHGGGDDVEPVQFRTTVTFEDLGAQRPG